MNLLKNAIFPIQFASGEQRYCPLNAIEQADVVDFAYPRADLNFAAKVFAIAVLQTVFAPKNAGAWLALQQSPPDADTLQQAFDRAAHAFNLDGDGVRFMQDFDALTDANTAGIDGLLFDTPGANTLKQNMDVFNHRGKVDAMGLPMAAMALFCFQSQAPAGGAGYRTGLRGGGPMSTLVMPQNAATLWQKLWGNVLHRAAKQWSYEDPDLHSADVFPWLAPTRESRAKNTEIYPGNVHPLTCYWAMPWRIRLNISADNGVCSVSGVEATPLVTGYQVKAYGNNYAGNWCPHPLTPYRSKGKGEWFSVKAKSDGISYKLWDTLTLLNQDDDTQQPAMVVGYTNELYNASRGRVHALQMHAFSYHLDKAKTIGMHDAHLPLYTIPDKLQAAFITEVKQLQTLADEIQSELRKRVREALGGADSGLLNALFLQRTEAVFYRSVDALAHQAECTLTQAVVQQWLGAMQREVMGIFDRQVLGGVVIGQRQAKARDRLNYWLHNNKKIQDFRKTYIKEGNA